jgi:hypothetical protein
VLAAHRLKYSVLSGRFAVCRLATDAPIPAWATESQIFSVMRTTNELSVVCAEELVPVGMQAESGWACIQLQGPFPFQMTGVLASILDPLAAVKVGIFALSTFDTDYILVKADELHAAEGALRLAGHARIGSTKLR